MHQWRNTELIIEVQLKQYPVQILKNAEIMQAADAKNLP